MVDVKVIQKITPVLKDRVLILILCQLIVDVIKMNCLGIKRVFAPGRYHPSHPNVWNTTAVQLSSFPYFRRSYSCPLFFRNTFSCRMLPRRSCRIRFLFLRFLFFRLLLPAFSSLAASFASLFCMFSYPLFHVPYAVSFIFLCPFPRACCSLRAQFPALVCGHLFGVPVLHTLLPLAHRAACRLLVFFSLPGLEVLLLHPPHPASNHPDIIRLNSVRLSIVFSFCHSSFPPSFF